MTVKAAEEAVQSSQSLSSKWRENRMAVRPERERATVGKVLQSLSLSTT